MRTDNNKGPNLVKIGDNPDVQWDLQVLISIFHDHHDSLFGTLLFTNNLCSGRFSSNNKSKDITFGY